MKVLLKSFHMNGHTVGFHPETKKFEPPIKVSVSITDSGTGGLNPLCIAQSVGWLSM